MGEKITTKTEVNKTSESEREEASLFFVCVVVS